MLKEGLLAASALAALSTATPTQAAPVSAPISIGLIDVAAQNIEGNDRNLQIDYREFAHAGARSGRWPTESGLDHGVVVATAFVQQVRAMDKNVPIKIYAANTMEQGAKETSLKLNYTGARQALKWFAEHDVKVVLTTMVGKDTPEMQAFMADAKKLNMVVFASAGNDMPQGQKAYPAAYPEAIAVAADNFSLAFTKDPSISRWIDFTMDGAITLGRGDARCRDEGSSMAVARAAAIGAYAQGLGKAHDREGIRETLRGVAKFTHYRVNGVEVSAARIDHKTVAAAVQAAPVRTAAKQDEGLDPAVMAAYMSRGTISR